MKCEEMLPSQSNICEWYHKFKTTGNMNYKKRNGYTSTSDECMKWVHETFSRNVHLPTKGNKKVKKDLTCEFIKIVEKIISELLYCYN